MGMSFYRALHSLRMVWHSSVYKRYEDTLLVMSESRWCILRIWALHTVAVSVWVISCINRTVPRVHGRLDLAEQLRGHQPC